MSIESKVRDAISKPINDLGIEIKEIKLEKENGTLFLRIFIDKPEGIDLSDCEKVNDEIMEKLDEADYIKEQYFLEVSSPGIERVLKKDKHLEKNIGAEVHIKLFKKDEKGLKEYQGILKSFDENTITIELEDELTIDRKNIAQIKTVYNWE